MFLCEKERNMWKKSKENLQKWRFSAFSAGKINFLKIRLVHILDIAILHQCAKFHEKI